jgi:mannitol 2-dehydrogenase
MREIASLRNSSLARLGTKIKMPAYERNCVGSGVVHFGVGAFNRSHLAVYLDDLLCLGEEKRWGESGIGLLEGDLKLNAALTEQDYLYGLLVIDNDDLSYRIIGSLTGHLYAPGARESVLKKLSSKECGIVSLTVTEGGYFVEDTTHTFLEHHPDIQQDLTHPEEPRTWVGFVAQACQRRMENGGAPFTLLSGDNVHENGAVARTALLSFAELRGTALRRWIKQNVSFPNSMVDRITPRTTDDDRAVVADRFGVQDLAPVVAEPFRQWVLEDSFVAGRPKWELVDVQMTSDVAPYEKMKMRLLNGGHSTVGYVGDLLGYSYITEAVGDPQLRELLIHFMETVRPTLSPVPGINLDDYTKSIVRRFSNSAIRDQVARICSDGCAKIAKFIVPSLKDLLISGRDAQIRDAQILAFVIATWLHYLRGFDENGRSMTISDRGLVDLKPFRDSGCANAHLALETRAVFGDLAAVHPPIIELVQTKLGDLRNHGVRAAISNTLAAPKMA